MLHRVEKRPRAVTVLKPAEEPPVLVEPDARPQARMGRGPVGLPSAPGCPRPRTGVPAPCRLATVVKTIEAGPRLVETRTTQPGREAGCPATGPPDTRPVAPPFGPTETMVKRAPKGARPSRCPLPPSSGLTRRHKGPRRAFTAYDVAGRASVRMAMAIRGMGPDGPRQVP